MRIDFFPTPFLLGVSLLVLWVPLLRLFKKRWAYIFFFSVFWVYFLILVGLVVFPLPMRAPFAATEWGQSFQAAAGRINWLPHNYSNLDLYPFYYNFEILANVFLTLPLGFGILWVLPSLSRVMIPLALLVGVINEGVQFMMLVLWGFGFRVVDINDVFLNAGGVLIGYFLFKILTWAYRLVVQRFRLQPTGLWAHVYEISMKTKLGKRKEAGS